MDDITTIANEIALEKNIHVELIYEELLIKYDIGEKELRELADVAVGKKIENQMGCIHCLYYSGDYTNMTNNYCIKCDYTWKCQICKSRSKNQSKNRYSAKCDIIENQCIKCRNKVSYWVCISCMEPDCVC